MIRVTSNTLAPEQRRKPQTWRYLILRDKLIRPFGLIDDKFGSLAMVSELQKTYNDADAIDLPESQYP